jgi:CBS domain-containing protein
MTTLKNFVRNVVTVHPDDALGPAWRRVRDEGLGGLPVVDAGMHVVGMLSEDDLLVRCLPRRTDPWWALMLREAGQIANDYRKVVGTTVGDVMSAPSMTIDIDATVAEAAERMHDHRTRLLPVVANGILAGVVTAGDVIDDSALPARPQPAITTDADLAAEMRRRIEAEPWAARHRIRVAAHHGILELDGLVICEAERAGLTAMARTIPGCTAVKDRLLVREELRRNASLTRLI